MPPPISLKPKEVKRVIALVVDDLGLSPSSIAQVHSALKRFVDHDIQPGDLVAIVRTGAGVGALQQFTTGVDPLMLDASYNSLEGVQEMRDVATANIPNQMNAKRKQYRESQEGCTH